MMVTGGFIVAIAIERWNLHRRIALCIMLCLGSTPSRFAFTFKVLIHRMTEECQNRWNFDNKMNIHEIFYSESLVTYIKHVNTVWYVKMCCQINKILHH